jgi:hypothetical protein
MKCSDFFRFNFSVARWYIFWPEISILIHILEGLGVDKFGKFDGQVLYFVYTCCILWTFVVSYEHLFIFCGNFGRYFVIFGYNFSPVFGMLYQEKSGNPVQLSKQSQPQCCEGWNTVTLFGLNSLSTFLSQATVFLQNINTNILLRG